jgi:hypothetical protein
MYDRQPAVLVVTIIVFTIATLFVVLRAVSRIGIVHRTGLSDYFMLVAWVRSVPTLVLLPVRFQAHWF